MGDLFDVIESLEQELILIGEQEGTKNAKFKNFERGFVLGWQQACHIQRELGMIEGFLCSILRNSLDIKLQDKESLLKIILIIKSFDQWDPSAESDLEGRLRTIHTKTKLVLKKMNIHSKILAQEIDSEF